MYSDEDRMKMVDAMIRRDAELFPERWGIEPAPPGPGFWVQVARAVGYLVTWLVVVGWVVLALWLFSFGNN